MRTQLLVLLTVLAMFYNIWVEISNNNLVFRVLVNCLRSTDLNKVFFNIKVVTILLILVLTLTGALIDL